MADLHMVNKHGVLHSWPEDRPLPAGARKASKEEVVAWQKEDAANKAITLAAKQKKAQERAQMVIVTAPAAETPKGKDDAK